jgi:polysaccharide biosynthesis protein PslH
VILFIAPVQPAVEGSGSAQRAARLIEALGKFGPVHVVFLYRGVSPVMRPIDDALAKAASFSILKIRSWRATSVAASWVPWSIGSWIDYLRYRSIDAPKLSSRVLRQIASDMPKGDFDFVFATRTSTAMIIDDMISAGLFQVPRKFVDFDDLMSRFRIRQLDLDGPSRGLLWRLLSKLQIREIIGGEHRIASGWDGVGVCSDEDVGLLTTTVPGAKVTAIPNVIERPLLELRTGAGSNMLFVGSFNYFPNVEGLTAFLQAGWPIVKAARPDIAFTAVGMLPEDSFRQLVESHGVALCANVPSVEPYYRDCDMVICPIMVGGGTRIKLIEAMAYGRPIVSTVIGAEGLGLVDGEHALIVETMEELADAVLRLAGDPELRARLVRNAHALQQQRFGAAAMSRAITEMVGKSQTTV